MTILLLYTAEAPGKNAVCPWDKLFRSPHFVERIEKEQHIPCHGHFTPNASVARTIAGATISISKVSAASPCIREEKGTQTQTFGSGDLPVGWGSSTWRDGGQKVRYVPRNPGKPNFLAGYPGIFAGISLKCPKSLRKKSLCSILVPYCSPSDGRKCAY